MRRSLDKSEGTVGLAGDWEGSRTWARRALTTFAEHGALPWEFRGIAQAL